MHDKQIRRRRAVLALLVGISLILLTAYFGKGSNGPLHSVQRGIADVLSPVESGASKVLSPVRDIAGWFSSTINAKSRNSALTADNQALTAELGRAQYEVTQLKQQAKLTSLDQVANLDHYSPVAANVIGSNPNIWWNTITVDAGSGGGVKVGDPVVGGDTNSANSGGLVGRVTDVGNDFSVVTLLTAPSFAVGAMVQEGNGAQDNGVLQPAVGNPNSLQLEYLPSTATNIQPSDEVVTSGFEQSRHPQIKSFAPPGIPIGQVSDVNENDLINNGTVIVSPEIDLRHLTLVQILTHLP